MDDLIEPFRPLVDEMVFRLAVDDVEYETDESSADLPRHVKHELVLVHQRNCTVDQEVMPIALGCQRLSESLVRALREKEAVVLKEVGF